MKSVIQVIVVLFFCSQLSFAQTESDQENKDYPKVRAVAELGYLAVLKHNVQFSNSGTDINYVADAGQDILFAVSRLSLELDINKKNTLIFLYQPLSLVTEELLTRDLIVDDLLYEAGSAVRFTYNFPFYRFSYLRELMSGNEDYSFAVGLTAQIRNATIKFESLDGQKFRRNSDIGFVPTLKIRSTANFTDRIYGEIEADGIYAPVSYLNGSDNEVVGAILDASLRMGYRFDQPVNAFANLRYLGGGAVGTSEVNDSAGDGYVKNWLNFLTVSAGFVYELR